MGDIATRWNVATGDADWAPSGADLARDEDLATAVLISLFTDQTAAADDPAGDDRRGWWGDEGEVYPIGSKIWLRVRSKQTQATLDQVADDIRQALKWMIDDGVAASIDVHTEWSRPGLLGAEVTIHRSAAAPLSLTYAWAWQGI